MALKKVRRGAVAVISLFIAGAMLVGHVSAQGSPDVEREFERATQLHQAGDLQGAVRAYLAILDTQSGAG